MLTSPAPEPRHTPLGGLKRLGTVMNRRKSVANPTGFGEKKHRSPFASFKRGDSHSRDATIPESSSGTDRPGTALTTQESRSDSVRQPSESHERDILGTTSPTGFAQPTPVATNGTTAHQDVPAGTGTANTTINEVCNTRKVARHRLADEWIRYPWTPKDTQRSPRQLMISRELKEKRLGNLRSYLHCVVNGC